MKKCLALVLSLLLCMLAVSAFASETVKVGLVGSTNEQWSDVLKPKLAEEGIDLELVYFNDYVQPNIALANGDIDINAFQHHNFLNNWNEENSATYGGKKLVAICDTLIAPLSLHSKKIKSVDEIKDGDTILVPNDVVNEARTLEMLEKLGFIKLEDNTDSYATVTSIIENPKNLKIIEMDASMIASQLEDKSVAAGFLNGQFASQAGLKSEDALAIEEFDPNNEAQRGIINVIAAREENADNPTFKRIAEAYQTDDVKNLFTELYPGIFIAAWGM